MFSGQRLKTLRQQEGRTQADLALVLGINRASYASWELERARPNQAHLQHLSQYFGVEETYFESEYVIVQPYLQLNTDNKRKAEDYVEQLLETQKDSIQEKLVPLFAVQVLDQVPLSAGFGETYYDEQSFQTVYTDQEYSYDFASFIQGDSMEPQYFDGEVALFDDDGFDYDGAVYAISLNGRAYIKRVYREEEGYRIVSFNETYEDLFAGPDDDFRIVGKVIGHFRPIEEL
ncbi:helix-turn-helix transcriptional regulator [Streptococcus danieliae]|uniref:Helix-turn-helix transcriptional regulator n=1 Tax=Streptococcus danieliae TaxID=747656 RepID=A0A7Z0RR78_9STRE|nr:XRE family transcriptional regulator [Streptococcus danieliae]MBF0717457.1 helix-turn-helix transcriptional regulator [Streptococcus danieliae]NYS49387.1 helix-turn-helix transcriptional regulator [Streptococcus danieliae]